MSLAKEGEKGRNALEASQYTWPLCIWEMSYLAFTMFMWAKLVQLTVSNHAGPLPVVVGFVISQLFVDFISGLAHWGADTWGKFETPIFGPTLIRGFRMHHLDPNDITKHSFAETCANSSYPAPFVMALSFYYNTNSFVSQTYNWVIIFAIVFGILTNQCHKWSHMEQIKPNFIVRFLQQSGLIISHQKHHRHHQGDFDTDYCIINGWMNPILEKINFWRRLEALITKYTGYVPREDDVYWRRLKEM